MSPLASHPPRSPVLLWGALCLFSLGSLLSACEEEQSGPLPLRLSLSGCLGEAGVPGGCRENIEQGLAELPLAGCLFSSTARGSEGRLPLRWREGRPTIAEARALDIRPGDTVTMSLFLFNPESPAESCDGLSLSHELACNEESWCGLRLTQEGRAPASGGVFDFSPSGRGCARSTGYIPLGRERCDGIDNDCDGRTDEDDGLACLLSNEGCEGPGRLRCDESSGDFVCDGELPTESPERCGDALDNDCDGEIDEGYEQLGEACSTEGEGCVGQLSCPEEAGMALICLPSDADDPSEARCNGVDDDCDGLTDEGYAPQPLGEECGRCGSTAYQICVEGSERSSCVEEASAEEERSCDAIDEDCDGLVDERFDEQGMSCVVPDALGRCAAGSWRCDTGRLRCQGEAPLPDELCNGEDDDCDGEVDEGLMARPDLCDGLDDDCDGETDEDFVSAPISCAFGISCELEGSTRCVDGAEVESCPEDPRIEELCDNLDNDCDDNVDEALVRLSERQLGLCMGMEENCLAGLWRARLPMGYEEGVERSCDARDNDCDGEVDEQIFRADPRQRGVCQGLQDRCREGDWEPIYPDNYEGNEQSCDNLDNDCDGVSDEGIARLTENQRGVCAGRTERCERGVWSALQPASYEAEERSCDNLDNDCDGLIDEGISRLAAEQRGVCEGLTERCVRGEWTPELPALYEAGQERRCDNQDNDCDGAVDENIFRESPLAGVCEGAQERCLAGAWPPPAGSPGYELAEQSCDLLDNDCDGEIDEAARCDTPCAEEPTRDDCLALASRHCRAGIRWLRDGDEEAEAQTTFAPAEQGAFAVLSHEEREHLLDEDLFAAAFRCEGFVAARPAWMRWLQENCKAVIAWGDRVSGQSPEDCGWEPALPNNARSNGCSASRSGRSPSWFRIDRDIYERPLGLAVVCESEVAGASVALREALRHRIGRDTARRLRDGECQPADEAPVSAALCDEGRYECSFVNGRNYSALPSTNPGNDRAPCLRLSISSPSAP